MMNGQQLFSREDWRQALAARLQAATVAVCGLGGLGSNIALALARAGVGRLLLLDFDRGEEELSRRIRDRYGAACLHLGQGQPPLAAVELAPRPDPLPRTLTLWGKPELQGLTLSLGDRALPPELPALPFLELLWETGRIAPRDILVVPGAE